MSFFYFTSQISILVVHSELVIASRASKHKTDNVMFRISAANTELSRERERSKFSCFFLVANSAIHELPLASGVQNVCSEGVQYSVLMNWVVTWGWDPFWCFGPLWSSLLITMSRENMQGVTHVLWQGPSRKMSAAEWFTKNLIHHYPIYHVLWIMRRLCHRGMLLRNRTLQFGANTMT